MDESQFRFKLKDPTLDCRNERYSRPLGVSGFELKQIDKWFDEYQKEKLSVYISLSAIKHYAGDKDGFLPSEFRVLIKKFSSKAPTRTVATLDFLAKVARERGKAAAVEAAGNLAQRSTLLCAEYMETESVYSFLVPVPQMPRKNPYPENPHSFLYPNGY
ncbi:MAG: hypothetical protein NT051_06100 [Candidatus Micrarchaeota archaeon]|nr:hypothetical protein [Candidatus Micrarchaeota archaeon]